MEILFILEGMFNKIASLAETFHGIILCLLEKEKSLCIKFKVRNWFPEELGA